MTASVLRQVSNVAFDSAKQSERASEMRRVHNSALGFICVVHSNPEGEKVGINKQLCLYATAAPPTSMEVLKRILLSNDEIIPEDKPTAKEIYNYKLARVFINGILIGFTRSYRIL
jgi:DNA-directed RNA polymerase beta subunit